MHVETRRIVAHATRTGELPQNRCRYRVNKTNSMVAVARAASARNSGPRRVAHHRPPQSDVQESPGG
jgi:hypothetical protein